MDIRVTLKAKLAKIVDPPSRLKVQINKQKALLSRE